MEMNLDILMRLATKNNVYLLCRTFAVLGRLLIKVRSMSLIHQYEYLMKYKEHAWLIIQLTKNAAFYTFAIMRKDLSAVKYLDLLDCPVAAHTYNIAYLIDNNIADYMCSKYMLLCCKIGYPSIAQDLLIDKIKRITSTIPILSSFNHSKCACLTDLELKTIIKHLKILRYELTKGINDDVIMLYLDNLTNEEDFVKVHT